MPKPTKGPRIGGTPAHERIILANLASQLFEHGRITTTEAKAKRVRPLAETLITKAKRGDLHNRRQVLKTITDRDVVAILFDEIAPSMDGRDGGYTRINKIGPRKGDNAPMAILEIITEKVAPKAKPAKSSAEDTKAAIKADPKADESSAAESTEAEAAESAAEGDITAADKFEAKSEDVDLEGAATLVGDAADEADAKGDEDAEPAAAEAKDYGKDSHRGEEPPAGYDIKGNENSMKFHTPESPWYDRTIAEVWFNSAEAAEAAGFVNAVQDDADEADKDEADKA